MSAFAVQNHVAPFPFRLLDQTRLTLLGGLLGCALSFNAAGAAAQNLSVPEAQIVLFTPSDIQPPRSDYRKRLDQFGRYAEQFFHDGLTDWGYTPARKEIFTRGDDGKISVIHVKGDLPAAGGAYKKQWISRQVHDKLKSEHGIKIAGNLYWIFVYVGDPPAKHDNYRGSGNSKDGGWAVLNYTNLPGTISPRSEMVSPLNDKLTLKGCIHEFGHALGLPHIGPKVELGKGNTLMGPVNRIYRYHKMPDRTKAYLSEAGAAILSTHPVFTGNPASRSKLPRTGFQRLTADYDRKTHAIVVRGKLESDFPIHRIVVIDDRDDKIGGYWVKGFVAQVDPQARFSLSIPTPGRKGQLKILAVYANGAFTGDGRKRGIESATLLPYSFGR
ncbi:hypothetical protein Mal15_13020 [Stieleria maiorica]|uniref:Uncharacterized protein n=1 Tax=Stieleria maiorica TaxID=2795974 RepID=A0A5B9M9A3_9BACT|nr:hypothetical protein [Stieleria maiorica]QEF97263.1 hypothetical protein Mal15_13020 [Stieleria maiorica]